VKRKCKKGQNRKRENNNRDEKHPEKENKTGYNQGHRDSLRQKEGTIIIQGPGGEEEYYAKG